MIDGPLHREEGFMLEKSRFQFVLERLSFCTFLEDGRLLSEIR
jgi:hypothetical protein